MTRTPPSPPLSTADLDHVVEHTRALWEEARGRTFFITGGTGFFGSWLLESFAHANETLDLVARAVVLTRDPENFRLKSPHLSGRHDIELRSGNVRNFAFPTGEFHYVIHAATEVGHGAEASARILDTAIDGTRRVLEFVRQARTAKLLLTSSGAVYGPQPAGISHVSEEFGGAHNPLLTTSAYGIGKRVAEHLCVTQARRFGFEAKIARCFAFVGPHLPLEGDYAIGNFIRDALDGTTVHVRSDGTPRRSYLYAADLAVWLWTILFKGVSGDAYNVGSEDDRSLLEVAEAVCRRIPTAQGVDVAGRPDPKAPVARYVPSTSKAALHLGLHSSIDLDSAIDRTATWHQRMRLDGSRPEQTSQHADTGASVAVTEYTPSV